MPGTGSLNKYGGRIILLGVRRNGAGEIDAKQKFMICHEKPVYSAAAFGSS
jgi:hypothetical protein